MKAFFGINSKPLAKEACSDYVVIYRLLCSLYTFTIRLLCIQFWAERTALSMVQFQWRQLSTGRGSRSPLVRLTIKWASYESASGSVSADRPRNRIELWNTPPMHEQKGSVEMVYFNVCQWSGA